MTSQPDEAREIFPYSQHYAPSLDFHPVVENADENAVEASPKDSSAPVSAPSSESPASPENPTSPETDPSADDPSTSPSTIMPQEAVSAPPEPTVAAEKDSGPLKENESSTPAGSPQTSRGSKKPPVVEPVPSLPTIPTVGSPLEDELT